MFIDTYRIRLHKDAFQLAVGDKMDMIQCEV